MNWHNLLIAKEILERVMVQYRKVQIRLLYGVRSKRRAPSLRESNRLEAIGVAQGLESTS